MGRPFKDKDEEEHSHSGLQTRSSSRPGRLDEKSVFDTTPLDSQMEVPVGVIEQRVSNLIQGALCLVLLTGPFLHILNLVPRGTHRILCLLLV
jgi:boron transporter